MYVLKRFPCTAAVRSRSKPPHGLVDIEPTDGSLSRPSARLISRPHAIPPTAAVPSVFLWLGCSDGKLETLSFCSSPENKRQLLLVDILLVF